MINIANLVLTASRMVALNRPSRSEWRSVNNYLNAKRRVHLHEQTYICHKEDLISLRPGRDTGRLDEAIHALLRLLRCSLVEV